MSTSSVGVGLCQAGLWCGGGVLCPVLGWLSQDQLTKITNTLCGAEDSNPVRQLRNTSGIFRLKSISERHIHVNNHHHKGGQCLRSPAPAVLIRPQWQRGAMSLHQIRPGLGKSINTRQRAATKLTSLSFHPIRRRYRWKNTQITCSQNIISISYHASLH